MSYINPHTGDYVLENGKAKPDPRKGLANAVYMRLLTPLGTWWVDPTLGSRLHELYREKDVPRVMRLTKQYVIEALTPLVKSARVKQVDCDVFRPMNGRLEFHALVTTYEDEEIRFKKFIQVGS